MGLPINVRFRGKRDITNSWRARHLVALIEIAVADVLHGSNVFF